MLAAPHPGSCSNINLKEKPGLPDPCSYSYDSTLVTTHVVLTTHKFFLHLAFAQRCQVGWGGGIITIDVYMCTGGGGVGVSCTQRLTSARCAGGNAACKCPFFSSGSAASPAVWRSGEGGRPNGVCPAATGAKPGNKGIVLTSAWAGTA